MLNTMIHQMAEEMLVEILESVLKNELKLEQSLERMRQITSEYALKLYQQLIQDVEHQLYQDKSGRKKEKLVVQRHNDPRTIMTQLGPLRLKRTYYYHTASQTYSYPIDQVMEVEPYQRIDTGLSQKIVESSCHQSYQRTMEEHCGGQLSRQTVLNKIRCALPVIKESCRKKKVPYLHIDADEDHVALQGKGKKSRVCVPLVSVYEGIEANGKRNYCKNVFHISAYGENSVTLWENVLTRIEQHYDLEQTKVYLHGDGAPWITQGLGWLPDAVFVLDTYHKNKYIKDMLAGCNASDRKKYWGAIKQALNDSDEAYFNNIVELLLSLTPSREDKIIQAADYLAKHMSAIAIRQLDPEASNGGCTEPHVSHVLSERLSSRPKGWSETTLKSFVPILANGAGITFKNAQILEPSQLASKAMKAVRKQKLSGVKSASMGILTAGKVTPLYNALYGLAHATQ